MDYVYLDHSATTPLAPQVLEAMMPHLVETYGNASSVHGLGRKARAVLEQSRETIAACISARPDEVFFTSGGTESDNHAIKGVAASMRTSGRDHVIVSAMEHHAVLHPALALKKMGMRVDVLPVTTDGVVDVVALDRLLSSSTGLVSVMHANNETGTIQPIREIADRAHKHGGVVHTDAVQSAGKIPVNVADLGVDLLSISAHKMYGPKGIGVLYIRKGTVIAPFLEGGGQEQNRRAGTENVPLAVGFAKAFEIAAGMLGSENARLAALRQLLVERLKSFKGILFNGNQQNVLLPVLSVSFDSSQVNVDGEALIMGMDLRGIAVTSGSACASGTLEPSHVLMAMGRDEKTARATIRFSMGRSTTEGDLEKAVAALRDVLTTMKAE
jgi:cysteine desulfurase